MRYEVQVLREKGWCKLTSVECPEGGTPSEDRMRDRAERQVSLLVHQWRAYANYATETMRIHEVKPRRRR